MAKIDAYPSDTSDPSEAELITQTDVTGGKHALDVAIKEGSVAAVPGGLSTAGLITEVTLSTASWKALPPTAQVGRNSMAFQNLTADVISVNFTTPGSTVGWKVNPNGEFFIDVTDSITVYAKALTGTPTITVMELS